MEIAILILAALNLVGLVALVIVLCKVYNDLGDSLKSLESLTKFFNK